MSAFIAKRVRFRNGERCSVLLNRATGLPVHEVALYVGMILRGRGAAANSIHQVVRSLQLLYNELHAARIFLKERIASGQLLTLAEVLRLAEAARYRLDSEDDRLERSATQPAVISLEAVRMRHQAVAGRIPVEGQTTATRLGHIRAFLSFLAEYSVSTLSPAQQAAFKDAAAATCRALKAQAPVGRGRNKIGKREGLDHEVEELLLRSIDPNSPINPWSSLFVRKRNWLIIVLLLATGMRRGELLVLRIRDLHPRLPLLTIPRRADSKADKRREEPNTKTFDREIELVPSVMKALRDYINVDRRAIRAARMHQYIIVSDEGAQLTLDSVNKMFTTLRVACPGLPSNLTAHILRHTWNDRFSEHAEAMQMSPEVEQKARANQQGWVETSGTAATYTRRYITKKAREATLKLQMELEEKAYGKSR